MGLYRRGKVWWMSFMYEGRQYRKSCQTTDKKLAEKIYHKVMTELVEGRYFERLPGERKTFREMMKKYEIEYFSTLPSGNSCRHYVRGLVEFFGNYTLKEITPNLIYEFKRMRRAQGVKPSTINRQLTIAKRAFNLAIKEWEWWNENPFAKVPSEKGESKRDRWLTLEEEERLLEVSPQWLKDFLIFAIWTGLREGNIIELKRQDVDLQRGIAYIRKTKNGEPLVLPLHEKALNVLKRRLKVRYLEHDYIFTSPKGKKIYANNLRRAFKKAIKKAGIKDLRIHDLRHTFGTRLAQLGMDLYTIAKLLGHRDIRATQRYAHHSIQSLKRSMQVLNKADYHNFITLGGNNG